MTFAWWRVLIRSPDATANSVVLRPPDLIAAPIQPFGLLPDADSRGVGRLRSTLRRLSFPIQSAADRALIRFYLRDSWRSSEPIYECAIKWACLDHLLM